VKAATYADGELFSYVDVEYGNTNNGWLPERWVGAYCRGRNKIDVSGSLRVAELSINQSFDPVEFDIPLRPGMIVEKSESDRVGKTRKYRVASDGHTLMEITGQKAEESSWRRIWIWLFIGSILLAGATCLVAILKKRSKFRASLS
jgi:hypothetical protein